MKSKISELSGKSLCYAVCMIEMPHLVWGETIGIHFASAQIVVPGLDSPDRYSPYMNWKMFGPIIERERIELSSYADQWQATAHLEDGSIFQRGPTPLIAAMRCYLVSKLGDEVDIPEELFP